MSRMCHYWYNESMKVIYSIGSKFGGHGIGGVATQAVRGIYRARALKKVLASYQSRKSNLKTQMSNPHVKSQNSERRVPKKYVKTMGLVGLGLRRLAYYEPTGWGYVLHDNVFDRWASGQIGRSKTSSEVGRCDIFHGWNHHCLRSLLRAKELGAVTVVERASSHILQGQQILQEEYKKYGVRGSFRPQTYIEKCLKEYEEADYILVPSDYARQSFLKRGFNEEKIVKIPFGVDSNRFVNCLAEPATFGLKSQIVNRNKFIVLYVGEIRLGKGVQYLLEAWDKLKLRDAELWLVGEMKRDIRKVARKQENKKTIKFLGFQKNIPGLMSRASVFAFPSLDEGSALVTYEAMAAGLPVITTPNAGSLVRDSLDGYIIPIRDSEALAERLEFFYKYPEPAKLMGERGKERIKEFTWERYGEELVKAYIRMLK